MKSIVGFFVTVVVVSKSTLALECFECSGSSPEGCYSKKVTCIGSCYFALSMGQYDSSLRAFARGCIAIGNTRLDGCGDAHISYSGVAMNQRQCFCIEDRCNDKPIYSVNSVVNKAIQCYECSGAECGYSDRTVSCNGACTLAKNYNGEVSKSCVTNSDIFGTSSSIGVAVKFTGCVSTGDGRSKSEVYMCHDNFCNSKDQFPCKFTSEAPCMWICKPLAIVTAIAAVLTI